jgi:hypothetical protein
MTSQTADADVVCSEKNWARLVRRILVSEANECWPWTGPVTKGRKGGYPRASVQRKMRYVHRVVLERKLGRLLGPEECTLHSCDNRRCCNPAHLSVGSRLDNNRDRDLKGRNVNPVGSSHGNAKLVETSVLAIRTAYAAGDTTQTELARRFGVHKSLISIVVRNKGWRHV